MGKAMARPAIPIATQPSSICSPLASLIRFSRVWKDSISVGVRVRQGILHQ